MGWYVALSIILPTGGGYWLDIKIDSRPLFTLSGLGLGIIVAFYGIYRMVRQIQITEDKQITGQSDKEQN